jgi:hypothetical protein
MSASSSLQRSVYRVQSGQTYETIISHYPRACCISAYDFLLNTKLLTNWIGWCSGFISFQECCGTTDIGIGYQVPGSPRLGEVLFSYHDSTLALCGVQISSHNMSMNSSLSHRTDECGQVCSVRTINIFDMLGKIFTSCRWLYWRHCWLEVC